VHEELTTPKGTGGGGSKSRMIGEKRRSRQDEGALREEGK